MKFIVTPTTNTQHGRPPTTQCWLCSENPASCI